MSKTKDRHMQRVHPKARPMHVNPGWVARLITTHKRLKPVEERSIERVEESQIFKGLTALDIKSGAEEAVETGKIVLRPGWQDFFLTQPDTVILSISRLALPDEQKESLSN